MVQPAVPQVPPVWQDVERPCAEGVLQVQAASQGRAAATTMYLIVLNFFLVFSMFNQQ